MNATPTTAAATAEYTTVLARLDDRDMPTAAELDALITNDPVCRLLMYRLAEYFTYVQQQGHTIATPNQRAFQQAAALREIQQRRLSELSAQQRQVDELPSIAARHAFWHDYVDTADYAEWVHRSTLEGCIK